MITILTIAVIALIVERVVYYVRLGIIRKAVAKTLNSENVFHFNFKDVHI